MILNDETTLIIVNKYTLAESIYPVKHLTEIDFKTDG